MAGVTLAVMISPAEGTALMPRPTRKPTSGHRGADQLTTWVPSGWSPVIDEEVERLRDLPAADGPRVSRSDIVRAALIAYFADSETRRETHFIRARSGDAL